MSRHVLKRLIYQADGCLVFHGGRNHGGYGVTRVTENGQPRHYRVHRYVYEHTVGPIPDELQLDHLCRNRACANPMHLEPVTRSENMRRAALHWPKTRPNRWKSAEEVCGTPRGAKRHARRGETPCEPCVEARRAWKREYMARRRSSAA